MRDPYEVLGIDRKASAGDIKSAYRKLAKKLHPDANKNDPKSATRFSELNAAHELLGDEARSTPRASRDFRALAAVVRGPEADRARASDPT